jgi:hypothetical protein
MKAGESTMKTVSQLTVAQLEALIEMAVERKLTEMLGDPDRGLELTPATKTKLRRSIAAIEQGERGIPAKSVAKELGLKW